MTLAIILGATAGLALVAAVCVYAIWRAHEEEQADRRRCLDRILRASTPPPAAPGHPHRRVS